jgi:ketosteroid isomerase-like protein
MKQLGFTVSVLLVWITACTPVSEDEKLSQWKKEITETEKSFAELAKTEGIGKAFLAYAAEDAVLMRNNTLVKGKSEIAKQFEDQGTKGKNVSLSWSPDFVDVSSSGDLGYTYGKFVYSSQDSLGQVNTIEGIFHTVWKRQPDGSWKFVWD